MIWCMFVQLVTGHIIGLDVASEEQCRADLARVMAGEHMSVTLKNGQTVDVQRGLDCLMRRANPGPDPTS